MRACKIALLVITAIGCSSPSDSEFTPAPARQIVDSSDASSPAPKPSAIIKEQPQPTAPELIGRWQFDVEKTEAYPGNSHLPESELRDFTWLYGIQRKDRLEYLSDGTHIPGHAHWQKPSPNWRYSIVGRDAHIVTVNHSAPIGDKTFSTDLTIKILDDTTIAIEDKISAVYTKQ